MKMSPLYALLACFAICSVVLLTNTNTFADDEKPAEKKEEVKKEEPAKKEEAPKKEAEAKKEEAKKEEEKPKEEKKEESKPEEKKAEEAASGPQAEPLVTNLQNPSGIAIQPETGHVFVASRHGIYRYVPGAEGATIRLEILNDNYKKTDIYGKGPKYDIGPLGLAFLDKDHLVVGDGSRPDGEELVRVYKIGPVEGADASPAKEETAVHTLGPIKAGDQSAKGEGNFYGVAVGAGSIFVTCNGDDTKGWVSRSEVKEGKPGDLTPYIATKEQTEVDAPVSITFSKDDKELVVGQMGEMNVAGDSLLTFYNPADGKLARKLKANLSDLAGLAYSPKTGKLYGTDFSWVDASKGGLFELVIEGEEVKPKKIMSLDKPTAIAFDKDGNLYLTTFGTAKEGDKNLPGMLHKIPAGL